MRLQSLNALADRLLAAKMNQRDTMVVALESSCKELQAEVKKKFGVYQPAVGDFHAWEQLASSTQKERSREGYTPNDPLLRDGSMLRDSVEYSVDPLTLTAAVGSKEMVMVYQELGTHVNGMERIPPRPVFGPAALENGPAIAALFGKLVARLYGAKETGHLYD